jgi:hypothetical protein
MLFEVVLLFVVLLPHTAAFAHVNQAQAHIHHPSEHNTS